MFFIMAISHNSKQLNFNQTIVCPVCGRFGRYEVCMEYMYLSLFFIPIFKWNKKYYVTSTCCGSTYSISSELGKSIARGDNVNLTSQDLQPIYIDDTGYVKRCSKCGFETNEDFKYCPKCATPL